MWAFTDRLGDTNKPSGTPRPGLTATTLIYAGHGVATEYGTYGTDTARGYLMSQQGGHGVATDRRTMRTGHRAGVFNEPIAVSPIETANGSHD